MEFENVKDPRIKQFEDDAKDSLFNEIEKIRLSLDGRGLSGDKRYIALINTHLEIATLYVSKLRLSILDNKE